MKRLERKKREDNREIKVGDKKGGMSCESKIWERPESKREPHREL